MLKETGGNKLETAKRLESGQCEQNLLQFQAARLLNAITLYRSLGGGWKS